MMREVLTLILVGVVLCGCARSIPRADRSPIWPSGQAIPYAIRISHNDATRFSGIIGVEFRADGVYCVLLDATGLTLMTGTVGHDGAITLENALEEVRKRKLPDLIAAALWAVYLAKPDEPCSWYQLHCIERTGNRETDTTIVTDSRFLFLPVWRTRIVLENSLPESVDYSLVLQNVEIEMKQLQE